LKDMPCAWYLDTHVWLVDVMRAARAPHRYFTGNLGPCVKPGDWSATCMLPATNDSPLPIHYGFDYITLVSCMVGDSERGKKAC